MDPSLTWHRMARECPGGTRGAPRYLFVAGSIPQAHHWAREILGESFDLKTRAVILCDGSQRLHGVSGFEEVFFVGEWGRVSASELAAIHMALSILVHDDPSPHMTWICDARGEVVERPAYWSRWPAASTGRITAWHLPDVHDGERGGAVWWSTMCGIPARLPEVDYAYEIPGYDTVYRWGAPRGACKACERLFRKMPPKRWSGAQPAAAVAMVGLKAQQAVDEQRRICRAMSRFQVSLGTLKVMESRGLANG